MIREQDIPELQDLYRKMFYKEYNPSDYRFIGVHFITGNSEPVILTGNAHSENRNIYCIANTGGIIQVCDSFEEAKRKIGG